MQDEVAAGYRFLLDRRLRQAVVMGLFRSRPRRHSDRWTRNYRLERRKIRQARVGAGDPELGALAEMPLHVRVHADVDIDVPEVLLEMQAFDVADLHALILHAGVAGLDAAGAIEGDGDRRAAGGELLEREPGDDGEGSDRDGPDPAGPAAALLLGGRRFGSDARGGGPGVGLVFGRHGLIGRVHWTPPSCTHPPLPLAREVDVRRATGEHTRREPSPGSLRDPTSPASGRGEGDATILMSAPWHCPTSAAGRIVWRRSWSARSPPERPEPPSRHAR